MKRRTLPWVVRLLGRRRDLPGTGGGLEALWEREAAAGVPLRVLVVRQDNRLGNLLLLVPFLRALRAALPHAEIAMLTGEAYADLVGTWPWVDRWIVQEKRQHAAQPWRFPGWLKRLRGHDWDVAFEMSNHNTHSYYNCVLTVASGAPIRIGFDEPRNANALTHPVPPPDGRMPFAFAPLALLRASGLPAVAAPPEIPLGASPSERLLGWRRTELGETPYALVHVGGRGGKSWPLECWTRLVPRIRARGGPRIVLVGGPDEIERMSSLEVRGRAPQTSEEAPLPELVAPLFELSDLAHLLRGARYYLGCDTGVMHLAAAIGTPTIALFFRSNPVHYAPLGGQHRTVLLADPYGAEDDRWQEAVEGVARSGLRVAPTRPEDSARGIPVTDEAADDVILEALAEVQDGPGEPAPETLR